MKSVANLSTVGMMLLLNKTVQLDCISMPKNNIVTIRKMLTVAIEQLLVSLLDNVFFKYNTGKKEVYEATIVETGRRRKYDNEFFSANRHSLMK